MSEKNLPKEIERKYIILRPSDEEISRFPQVDSSDIVQTYLTDGEKGMCRRVRRRYSPKKGEKFYYTQKSDVSFGERIELEREISGAEYLSLLEQADISRTPIEKKRHCFVFGGKIFELDVYSFEDKLATLEIELDRIDEEFSMPDFITVLKDVTGDKRYTNAALAATHSLAIE